MTEQDATDTIRAVIAIGSGGTFLTLLTVVIRQWVPLKRAKNEADASLRHDLLEEMGELRKEVTSARQETADERRRCDEAMSALRREYDGIIREMRGEIAGLHRQIVAASANQVLAIPASPSPLVQEAAERVKRIVRDEP